MQLVLWDTCCQTETGELKQWGEIVNKSECGKWCFVLKLLSPCLKPAVYDGICPSSSVS